MDFRCLNIKDLRLNVTTLALSGSKNDIHFKCP